MNETVHMFIIIICEFSIKTNQPNTIMKKHVKTVQIYFYFFICTNAYGKK